MPEEKFRNLQSKDELFLHFYINEPAYAHALVWKDEITIYRVKLTLCCYVG